MRLIILELDATQNSLNGLRKELLGRPRFPSCTAGEKPRFVRTEGVEGNSYVSLAGVLVLLDLVLLPTAALEISILFDRKLPCLPEI